MYDVSKKGLCVLEPKAIVNNASETINVIDCQGFDYLEVWVMLGASDIALSALKLQESDVEGSSTSLTSGTDITGTVFGTDNTDAGVLSVLPSATDDNKLFKFEIDLRGRKRYILPVITVGSGSTGAFVAILAELSRGQQMPTTATDKGVAQLMRV